MKSETVIEKAYSELAPIVESMGYEVVEIDYKYQFKSNNLIIYIHKAGGISLEDCEKVSKALDPYLDELDITMGATYNLNISSPGLDRPIVSDKDFARNMGLELEAHFIENVDKKKKVNGILLSYDDESFVLSVKGLEKKYLRNNIKLLTQHIKFG